MAQTPDQIESQITSTATLWKAYVDSTRSQWIFDSGPRGQKVVPLVTKGNESVTNILRNLSMAKQNFATGNAIAFDSLEPKVPVFQAFIASTIDKIKNILLTTPSTSAATATVRPREEYVVDQTSSGADEGAGEGAGEGGMGGGAILAVAAVAAVALYFATRK